MNWRSHTVLKGRTIETSWKVTNLNGKEMLFMIGDHPAFQVPEGKNIYDYTLVFNKEGVKAGEHQDSLHYQAPNAEGYEGKYSAGRFKTDRWKSSCNTRIFSIQH